MSGKRRPGLGLVVVLVLTVAMVAAAGEAPQGSVLKMKSGTCTFKVLDKDGVRPLSGAQLSLSPVAGDKDPTVAKADRVGRCAIELAAGRYVLAVNERNLSIIEAADAGVSECRILLPDAPMAVGGQEETKSRRGLFGWLEGSTAVVVGSVGMITGAGLVIDHNAEHGSGKPPKEEPPPPPQPVPTRRGRRGSQ